MKNQPMIDYINQQLNIGVKREEIELALFSQNWTKQDIEEGFDIINSQNNIWSRIKKINILFMTISLLLVFILDLGLVLNDGSLMEYWNIMLMVLGVFAVFFVLENFVFSELFSKKKSRIDSWIGVIVAIRNFIFVLNFIPYIQLLGIAAIMLGGWEIGILYIILIVLRISLVKRA